VANLGDGSTGLTGAQEADNEAGPRGRCHRLAQARAYFHHGPEREAFLQRGRRYDCSRPRTVTSAGNRPTATEASTGTT